MDAIATAELRLWLNATERNDWNIATEATDEREIVIANPGKTVTVRIYNQETHWTAWQEMPITPSTMNQYVMDSWLAGKGLLYDGKGPTPQEACLQALDSRKTELTEKYDE